MISQAEIIVGTEEQNIVAIAGNVRRLATADHPGTPQQTTAFDLFKFVLYCSGHSKPSHCQPAYYTKVDNVSKKRTLQMAAPCILCSNSPNATCLFLR
jgi:hypothetical protein